MCELQECETGLYQYKNSQRVCMKQCPSGNYMMNVSNTLSECVSKCPAEANMSLPNMTCVSDCKKYSYMFYTGTSCTEVCKYYYWPTKDSTKSIECTSKYCENYKETEYGRECYKAPNVAVVLICCFYGFFTLYLIGACIFLNCIKQEKTKNDMKINTNSN